MSFFTEESGLEPLPGFGLPIDHLPEEHFPLLLGGHDEGWQAATLLIRETCMLKFIEDITNKPEWWLKVHDEAIAARWKAEVLALDWEAYLEHADFTDKMADYCLRELRHKATLYQKTGLIPIIDYSACVLKSDSLVPPSLSASLLQAVKVLEDVPDKEKDWHPGSDGKVLDLVHPSLYPLVFGRSHVLQDRRIGVQEAVEYCGKGVVVPKRTMEGDEAALLTRAPGQIVGWTSTTSNNFQWLPCDVVLSEDGSAKIDSYINNLHPQDHGSTLYPLIEQFIHKALPAWDVIYRWPAEHQLQRLKTMRAGVECRAGDEICEYQCRPYNRPVDEDEPERDEDEPWEDEYPGSERERRDKIWFKETHMPDIPEMEEPPAKSGKEEDEGEEEEGDGDGDDDTPHHSYKFNAANVKTSGFFNNASRIQVIVKLANIHLTPESPSYDGGSWHTEGQLNEHIVATALFYYDADNITDCRLDFRTPANKEDLMMELDYEQDDHASIQRTFNIDSHGHTLQDVGSVLTRPGRSVFFPNLFQHHVSPFRLTDPTRPGHRKILALFLVDPVIPILSTANVPPQQKHWWSRATRLDGSGPTTGRLPLELTRLVVDNADFVMSDEEAKEIRKELMKERTGLQRDFDGRLRRVDWNFCEH